MSEGLAGTLGPSGEMLETARTRLGKALEQCQIAGFDVTHTGDDICLLMMHAHGSGEPKIHELAWGIFEAASRDAILAGL